MSQFFQKLDVNNQQSQPNSTIVVPLVKFSCSLTHQSSTTGSQWTHYSRNDLELVIQEVQVRSPQGQHERHLVMRVVAGAEYLEEQDLEDIARIFKNFIPSPGTDVPVRVVVKPPLLALRYPKFHDVRRLQFRFRDGSGFSQIFNVLTNLGLTATDSVSSGPALALQSRPSTVNSTSSAMTIAPSTPISYLPSSQNTEFKVPMRPESASSMIQRSSSSSTFRSDNNIPFSRPQSSMSISSFMPQSKPFVDPIKRAQSLYVSQFERDPQEIQSSNFLVPSSNMPPSNMPSSSNTPLNHDTYGDRVLLAKSEESQRRFSASPYYGIQEKDHMFNEVPSSSSVNRTFDFRYNEHETKVDGPSSIECRPLSRTTDYPIFNTLGRRPISLPTEHDICFGLSIPPKRKLPFSTAKKNLETPPIIPEDPSFTGPAETERERPAVVIFGAGSATEISMPTKKPAKRRIASRKGVTHLPKINAIPARAIHSNDPAVYNEPSPLATKNLLVPTAQDLPSKLQSKVDATKKQPVSISNKPIIPKMVNKSTQTQTLSGRDHTTALKPAQSASISEASSNIQSAPEPPQIFQDDLDQLVSRYGPRSRVSLPPNYSDVPENVRHKMLNDFIIEILENEDFLKLAEDMDIYWRRMGLR